jgi:hypothetical protein
MGCQITPQQWHRYNTISILEKYLSIFIVYKTLYQNFIKLTFNFSQTWPYQISSQLLPSSKFKLKIPPKILPNEH